MHHPRHLLDRLLAGAAIDVEEAIRQHPELTAEEARALRTLAFARGRGPCCSSTTQTGLGSSGFVWFGTSFGTLV
jgi:hypothetical protein